MEGGSVREGQGEKSEKEGEDERGMEGVSRAFRLESRATREGRRKK